MSAALRYEWRRLWTIRSTYWLIGLTLAVQGVLTFLVAWGLSTSGDIGDEEVEAVTGVMTLGASFGQSPLLIAYLVAMFGVFTLGHEYRYGMIRATLTAVPNRTAVFAAKVLVTVLVAAVMALLCALLGLLWASVFIDGGATSEGEVWQTVLGTVLYTVLFAVFALAATGLVRNQTGALAVVLLLPLVVENILKVILQVLANIGGNDVDDIAKVFPFDAGAQMFAGRGADAINSLSGFEPLGAVAGGLVMLVFVGALLAGAYALFLSRDA